MAKILYGVGGEGMGHATRSKVVIEHLINKNHEVHVVTSYRAYDFLKKAFPSLNVTKIHGFAFNYENNRLKKMKTLMNNVKRMDSSGFKIVSDIISHERPDIIFTDYEPYTAYLSSIPYLKTLSKDGAIPLVSIDNIHISSNCKVDVFKKYGADHIYASYFSDFVVPRLNVKKYIITTFFYPKIERKNTLLVPSLMRKELLDAHPKKGNHVLVYQTSTSNVLMFEVLKSIPKQKFIVYGFNKSKKDKNLTFKKFSETGFIRDLAECKAVIMNGGFSLMSESVFLKKPVFSIPVHDHFEQLINAIYLEKLGFGVFYDKITSLRFERFLSDLPNYEKNLKKNAQKDNSEAFKVIDETIAAVLKR